MYRGEKERDPPQQADRTDAPLGLRCGSLFIVHL